MPCRRIHSLALWLPQRSIALPAPAKPPSQRRTSPFRSHTQTIAIQVHTVRQA
jgi:hypothetical protein